MKNLDSFELQDINGGEVTLDVNKLIDQINPLNVFTAFGREVIYPYIWKPFTNLFK